MITHRHVLRPILRPLLATSTAGLLVLGGAAFVPAAADTPAAWDKVPDVSAFDFLLVLVLFPIGLALVISLLTLIPSLVHDRGYEPGQSWRGQSEWFGGPTKGVKAADDVTHEQLESGSRETGGGSGRW